MIDSKIYSLNQLVKKLNHQLKTKKKIVFTNGCFDILHAGHVTYLEKAKKQAEASLNPLNQKVGKAIYINSRGRGFQIRIVTIQQLMPETFTTLTCSKTTYMSTEQI